MSCARSSRSMGSPSRSCSISTASGIASSPGPTRSAA
jgi:hypothetical protein